MTEEGASGRKGRAGTAASPLPAPRTTCIRKAAWLIAWDPVRADIEYLRDVDMAFAGPDILHIGTHYDRPVDHEIDGRDLMVVPGLINAHFHSTATMIRKGITQDSCNYHLPSFYQCVNLLQPPDGAKAATTAFGVGRLLKGGTTTMVDWVAPYDGWLDVLAASGARVYAAPFFTSATWSVHRHRELEFHWLEDGGRALYDKALDQMERAESHPSGRLGAMVAPSELEACSADLLRESAGLARQTGRPFHVHVAESAREFRYFTRQYGMTPVQWAAEIGLLGRNCALGHGIFLDHHSQLRWPTRRDLSLIAESGTTVTHCPAVFALHGDGMEALGDYLAAGINVALGNDTFPHGMLDEMKCAIMIARLQSGRDFGRPTHPAPKVASLGAGEVLKSATVAAADYLGRPDLGRLAPGCKADFFTVDLTDPDMMPVRDPLRSLIYSAGDRAVRDVYVDGAKVVADGRLLTLDLNAIALEVQRAQPQMESRVAGAPDACGSTALDMWPMSMPVGTPET